MKVLLSAYACAPEAYSEPDVGWGVATEAARVHRVWVVTAGSNRPRIEAELARTPRPNLRVEYVGLRALDRLAGTLGHHLHYVLWQHAAWRRARAMHARVRFDLVHHVTYVNSWLPTWMGRLGVPFIWSAGYREPNPWPFLPTMSWRERAMEAVRIVLGATVGTLTRRALTSGARLVLSASDPRHWPRRPPVRAFALGGMHPHELERLPATVPRNGAPFTVASVGRLLGWKGFALGVRAFARLHHERPESRYWIIGDGPERRPLESLAQRLGCAQAVTFLGWLPRENVLHRLETADALLHPSLHEQFGYVMLEAMALGVPVVCLRAAGAAMLVDDDSGIRVAAREPDQTVDALHAALHRLASDAPVRRRLGDGARERARVHWAWPAVGRRLLALYDEVRGARP